MYAGSQATRWPDAPRAPAPTDLAIRLAAGGLADGGTAAGDRVAVVVGLGPDGGDAAREVAERIALTWGFGALPVGRGASATDAGASLALAAGLLEVGDAEAVLLVT